jgi:hypothetical protein
LLTSTGLSSGRYREKARRADCANNERMIMLAMSMYADEHNGDCPRKLDDLRKYITADRVFHCPSAPNTSETSYVIFCGTNADDIIVRENPADHNGTGGNIARRGGQVTWLPVSLPANNR